MRSANIVIVLTALFTGLMAGLFFSYSCSVMPATASLGDAAYISAMQSVNKAIQNTVFFIVFFGAPLLLLLSAYLHFSRGISSSRLLIIACILYLAGVLGVTIFGNIPLNDVLAKFDLATASDQSKHLQRMAFELPWNRLNLVRTVFAGLSFLLVLIAGIYPRSTRANFYQ